MTQVESPTDEGMDVKRMQTWRSIVGVIPSTTLTTVREYWDSAGDGGRQ